MKLVPILLTLCVVGIVLYMGYVGVPQVYGEGLQKWIADHPGEDLPPMDAPPMFQFWNLLCIAVASVIVLFITACLIYTNPEVPDGR